LSAGSHKVTVKDANGCSKIDSIVVNQPTAVTLSLSKTDVSCNGGTDGSVTATFGGGTGAFMIKLDDGGFAPAGTSPQTFNNLSAGSHKVTVKDANGCTKADSIVVGQPDAVTLSLSKTDVSCNGGNDGSVTATFGGGTGAFMIKLDGGSFAPAGTSPQTFNNLSAGSHKVTVKDANGCTKADSVVVGQPDAVALSLSKTDVNCNGGTDGSVTADFGGGTAPYKIKLDGGSFADAGASPQTFNNLSAGSHR
jgi:hypothetical protein